MAGSGNDEELKNWQRLARDCQDAGADGLELNFSCPHMDRRDMGSNIGKDEGLCSVVTEAVKERMVAAARLRVPLKVDAGSGANWDQAH